MDGLRFMAGLAAGRAPPETPPPGLAPPPPPRAPPPPPPGPPRAYPSAVKSNEMIATPTNTIVGFFMMSPVDICWEWIVIGSAGRETRRRYFLAPVLPAFLAALSADIAVLLATLRTIFTSSMLGKNSPSTLRPIDFQVNALPSNSV